MYSKQEASGLKQEFWTAFGLYMTPVLSAEGEKVNWINYKTGEKDIRIRMQADSKKAAIGLELSHKDSGIRQLYFEQFLAFKKLFEEVAGTGWTWSAEEADEYGKPVSRIYLEQNGLSIFNKGDWPSIISFLKPNLVALDAFWSEVKYGFESLR